MKGFNSRLIRCSKIFSYLDIFNSLDVTFCDTINRLNKNIKLHILWNFFVNILDDFNFDIMKKSTQSRPGHYEKIETRAVVAVRNSRLLLIDKFSRHVASELNYNLVLDVHRQWAVFGRFVAKFCSSVIS